MNIINQFRRKARVVESTTDMKQVAIAAQRQDEYYTTICEDDYPIILTISVQVKVCFVNIIPAYGGCYIYNKV